MTPRGNSPTVSAYLERSRQRLSAMRRSGESVERNLRRAAEALRHAQRPNGRVKDV